MTKRQTFYSFHFANDVMRVQQIRNMGVIEGNEPVAPNAWEEVKKKGATAIETWIDDNMRYKSCVVVLVGTDTSTRPWVDYEIKKAWRDKKGLLAIHVNHLTCPRGGKCAKGKNPFDSMKFMQANNVVVPVCYDPPATDAYNHISKNLAGWVDAAIKQRA